MAKFHYYLINLSNNSGTSVEISINRHNPYITKATLEWLKGVAAEDLSKQGLTADGITVDNVSYLGEMTHEEWNAPHVESTPEGMLQTAG